ncbi:energy transducer TonB [Halosquirtibacter laminarini]|uniref:Energy transducer TonB n=1 Tax=Halosquirtibacter laminarini TaxID=3374600 RepID=A0AC61NFW5_9BACT|nr:energy transducer TonB [Prolixibacteraceae bacterium]
MKKLLTVLFLFFASTLFHDAQVTAQAKEDPIFEEVEKSPSYPGGLKVMSDFIGENLKYPKIAQKKQVEGTVSVKFVIEKDGSVSNVRVARSVRASKANQDAVESLNKEAIRVIKMLKFIPGEQHGKKVRVATTCPLSFQLM